MDFIIRIDFSMAFVSEEIDGNLWRRLGEKMAIDQFKRQLF
jgi:hypothetical protein